MILSKVVLVHKPTGRKCFVAEKKWLGQVLVYVGNGEYDLVDAKDLEKFDDSKQEGTSVQKP